MAGRRKSSKSTSSGRFDLEKGPPKPPEEPKSLIGRLRAARVGKKPAPTDARSEKLDPSSPWGVDPRRFPAQKSSKEQLRFCLRYAVLAPSSHNTQPWKFRVHEKRIDVFADRTRALPVADPHDRELTISVGAALFNLRLAMRRFGLGEETRLFPDPKRPDLIATVDSGGRKGATLDEVRMIEAIPRRRTTRSKFEDRPVPAPLVGSMLELAKSLGASLNILVDDNSRRRLAKLVAEADVIQLSNKSFRRELAMWMHHNRTHHHDGVPGYAMGMKELDSLVAPLVVRLFDMGQGIAAKDEQLAEHSPLLAVITTPRDTPTDWVNAGQALAAVLARAGADGVTSSYLNQPIELPETRHHLAKLCDDDGVPQLVLRMGYGPLSAHTPRRELDDVLLPSIN